MAFGDTATLKDDFSGTFQNPITTNWTVKINSGDGNMVRESGRIMTAVSPPTRCSAWYDVSDPGADFDVYASHYGLQFGRSFYIYGRVADAGTASPDGYIARYHGDGDGNHLRLYRVDNGTETQIADSGGGQSGNPFGLRCQGSSIQGWLYSGGVWTLKCDATDGTYTAAGHAGVGALGSSELVGLDDFYFGDIEPLSTFVPRVMVF